MLLLLILLILLLQLLLVSLMHHTIIIVGHLAWHHRVMNRLLMLPMLGVLLAFDRTGRRCVLLQAHSRVALHLGHSLRV